MLHQATMVQSLQTWKETREPRAMIRTEAKSKPPTAAPIRAGYTLGWWANAAHIVWGSVASPITPRTDCQSRHHFSSNSFSNFSEPRVTPMQIMPASGQNTWDGKYPAINTCHHARQESVEMLRGLHHTELPRRGLKHIWNVWLASKIVPQKSSGRAIGGASTSRPMEHIDQRHQYPYHNYIASIKIEVASDSKKSIQLVWRCAGVVGTPLLVRSWIEHGKWHKHIMRSEMWFSSQCTPVSAGQQWRWPQQPVPMLHPTLVLKRSMKKGAGSQAFRSCSPAGRKAFPVDGKLM